MAKRAKANTRMVVKRSAPESTRLREQWSDVKLVAITGYGQDSDRARAHRTGFDAHLTKPVDVEAREAHRDTARSMKH